MALVKVKWFEIVTREKEFEIDGYRHKGMRSLGDMKRAIGKLTAAEREAAVVERGPDTVEGVEILREGEPTPEIKPAKQREDMF